MFVPTLPTTSLLPPPPLIPHNPHSSILATWSEVGAELADETNYSNSTGRDAGGEWMF